MSLTARVVRLEGINGRNGPPGDREFRDAMTLLGRHCRALFLPPTRPLKGPRKRPERLNMPSE
jgi:hypothetical protein